MNESFSETFFSHLISQYFSVYLISLVRDFQIFENRGRRSQQIYLSRRHQLETEGSTQRQVRSVSLREAGKKFHQRQEELYTESIKSHVRPVRFDKKKNDRKAYFQGVPASICPSSVIGQWFFIDSHLCVRAYRLSYTARFLYRCANQLFQLTDFKPRFS